MLHNTKVAALCLTLPRRGRRGLALRSKPATARATRRSEDEEHVDANRPRLQAPRSTQRHHYGQGRRLLRDRPCCLQRGRGHVHRGQRGRRRRSQSAGATASAVSVAEDVESGASRKMSPQRLSACCAATVKLFPAWSVVATG